MKRRNLFAGCILLSSLLVGCNKTSVDTHADVSYGDTIVANSRGDKLTVKEIYDYIVANQQDRVANKMLLKVLESQIDLEDPDMLALYKRYVNEYFNTTFVENSSYKYNGEFSEELLVKYLKSESYGITCGENITPGVLDEATFSCNYDDYIEYEFKLDIYKKMLKIQYIIDEKASLIDKNAARKVTYYTIAKGSADNTVREQLEGYVDSISKNHASTDETLIKSIYDIAESERKEALEKIAEEYAYISTSKDSSSGYTYLNKFTTCGDKRCSIEEGKEYQDNLIMDKEYYTTEVVVKSNETVLYEAARSLLFSDNINDYLYEIGDVKYLMSPAYLDADDKRVNDIILFDSSNSNYYLAAVEVINSESSKADQILVAEILIDKVSDSTIFEYCFDKADLKLYDKDIKTYFETKYGEVESK